MSPASKPSSPFGFPTPKRYLVVATALLWWTAGAFGCFPLGWVALAPLWILVGDMPRSHRLRWGYLTGFVSFWLINWWLVPTITHGAPAIGAPEVVGFFLSLVAVTLIAAIHATGPALAALVWRTGDRWAVLWVTLVWTGFDWARCHGPLAHSWGALAFSQTADLPLINALPQQHALTAFCVLLSATAARSWRGRCKELALGGVLVLGLVHGAGCLALRHPPAARPELVRIVQTNVSSLRKSGHDNGETPFSQAYRLTVANGHEAEGFGRGLELVVWPETTAEVRRYQGEYTGLDWAQWQLLLQEHRVPPLLMGANMESDGGRRTNEVLLVQGGAGVQAYAKARLVPFGERAPWVEWLPFLQTFAPQPEVEPGAPDQPPLRIHQIRVFPLICFESCFPVRFPSGQDSAFIAVVTNDEWFSGTEAPAQHRRMAILRAVENHMPLVQSANGGYSFAVDEQGRVIAALPRGMSGVLDVRLR